MRPIAHKVLVKKRKASPLDKKLVEVEKELTRETYKMMHAVLPAYLLALHELYGMGSKRCFRANTMVKQVFEECGRYGLTQSMIQMLYNETGIDMAYEEDGKSWHEVSYLNGDLDYVPKDNLQWLYMRQKQIKWVPAQLVAACLISAHRCFGFAEERLYKLMQEINRICDEYNWDGKRINEVCRRYKIDIVFDADTENEWR